MHILYIIPYAPNLIRTRSYNLIRSMAQRGHRISLLSLWTSPAEADDLAKLASQGVHVTSLPQKSWRSLWNCLLALPSGVPLQAVFSWNPGLAKLTDQILECNEGQCVDVIHVEHLRGARYGEFVKARSANTPVVWDSVDCISYLFQQASDQSHSRFGKLITRLDLKRTQVYEGQLATRFDHVLITSAVDRQALLDLVPPPVEAAPVSILPNGVDWDYFSVDQGVAREPATIILSGKMSYHANITMAMYLMNEIMPLVWSARPDVKLLIVGKDPPASIRLLADHPGVEVTGTVQDLRPYLQRSTLAVVPMVYGAGFQNKVIEAMASATPVVSTPGAAHALDAVPDRDLLVADGAQEFAHSILSLLDNPSHCRQVGDAGKQYVQEHHQWSKIAGRLEGVYDEILRARRVSRLQ